MQQSVQLRRPTILALLIGLFLVSVITACNTPPAQEESDSDTTIAESTDVPEQLTATPASIDPTVSTTTIPATEPGVAVVAPGVTMEFVEVPAGPFLMGEDDTDLADIKPQHELDLPTYYIGRTETTNAQFRPFVEGDGYTNQEYWTEAGWKWREEEGMTEPRWWNTSPWNDSTKPVAGISWYEAVAYANWLSDQTGHEYRLPTEAEWEKAARGSDGRIYPWGDQEPNDSLANYDGIDGGGTQPVGSYPDGASPYGALDMIGNLEEWCSTKAGKEYPYQVEDEWTASYLAGDSRRVQRGGGFITELDTFLQAANRENQVPSLNTYFTFRLASSSQP